MLSGYNREIWSWGGAFGNPPNYTIVPVDQSLQYVPLDKVKHFYSVVICFVNIRPGLFPSPSILRLTLRKQCRGKSSYR